MIHSFESTTAELIVSAAANRGLTLQPVSPEPSPQRFTAARMTPLVEVHALWEAAVRRLGDPLFPLRCGNLPVEQARSIVALAGMVSPTLGQGVARVVRYWPLVTNAFHWSVYEGDEQVTVSADMPVDAPLGWRCTMEFHVIDVIHTAQALTGGEFVPREIWLAHEPPRAVARALEEWVGARVRTGMSRVAIILERSHMELHFLSQTPPPFERFVLSLAEQGLADIARPPTFVERVESLVEQALPDEAATLDRVAKQAGVSTRTLHRRLGEHGTSFHAILDGVRRRRAELLLSDETRSCDEIADALGLSRRGFYRAFRRWTGVTPATYRNE